MIYFVHWSWKAILSIIGIFAVGMVWAGNRHASRVEAYRLKHPDALPDEIERALREEAIDANLENLFNKMKGRTRNSLGFTVFWYRDKLGRARYTFDTYDMRHTKFDHWLKDPPQEFRVPSSPRRP